MKGEKGEPIRGNLGARSEERLAVGAQHRFAGRSRAVVIPFTKFLRFRAKGFNKQGYSLRTKVNPFSHFVRFRAFVQRFPFLK
jgi:hypothetical protein